MLSDLLFRLRSLFRRKTVEGELDDELRFHFDQQVEKYTQSGLAREEAMRHARLEFGGRDQIKEECRDARGIHFIETLFQDVRYGLRMLRRSPGFTAIAILTLALGIGANTAIFSLLDVLMFRDLPVPHPEQLVRVEANAPSGHYSFVPALSLPMFGAIKRDQKVFSAMFLWQLLGPSNIETDGTLFRSQKWAVDGNFYSVLGAVPEIGRLISPEDVNLNSATPALVAVLGYNFWQSHYNGDRNVIGKSIKIEGIPFEIIGVTRRGFTGMMAHEEQCITIPLTAPSFIRGFADIQADLQRRDTLSFFSAARLKPGVTIEQAQAQLNSLWPAIRTETFPLNPTPEQQTQFIGLQPRVRLGAKGLSIFRQFASKPLQVLLGISGLVLLIACVNLASLTLARAAARNHEMGVRMALGASRWRLSRQIFTESLTLSLGGTLAGLVLASYGSRVLADFMFGPNRTVSSKPDLLVLGFVAAVAIFTGIFFGLAPAWRASREDPNDALQQSSRSVGHGTGRLGKALILTQVALSVVILACAGLFIRTLQKLQSVQPGFQIQGVLDVQLYPRSGVNKNLDLVSYSHELTDRLSALPGVESVAMAGMPVASSFGSAAKGHIVGTSAENFDSDLEMPTPEFFRTVGIRLLRGRMFTWQDNDQAPRVALISEDFAREFFPGVDAIGQHIDIQDLPNGKISEIIGVVSNASLYDIHKRETVTLYLPIIQYGRDFMMGNEVLVRTKVAPRAMTDPIRRAIESLGHDFVEISTVKEDINDSLLRERMTATLSGFFGALALLLAAIGLYGLMSYGVTRRTRELGIRMALGAQRGGVLRMVLRETLVLVVIGIVIGIPCALTATRLIAHMLFGVTPSDSVTLICVSAALMTVGAIAGYLPARRAMRVSPMDALRYE